MESICDPSRRVSAAMLERRSRVIVRESHSLTLNLALEPKDTISFTPR